MVDDVALRLHVLAGVLALAAGPVAMVTRKGGTSHRRCGRLYCGAMAVAGITAMILSYRFGSRLMALLTVFACYLTFSGYRSVRRRCGERPSLGTIVDVGGLLLGGGSACGLLVLAVEPGGSRAVPGLFGLMGAVLVACDAHEIVSPKARWRWRSAHLGKMLGAYVASVTAVSVVQLPQLGELRWVWPSLVGVPAILAVVRADQARGRRAASVGPEILPCGQ